MPIEEAGKTETGDFHSDDARIGETLFGDPRADDTQLGGAVDPTVTLPPVTEPPYEPPYEAPPPATPTLPFAPSADPRPGPGRTWLVAAVIGAVVGAVVAGGIVYATRDGSPAPQVVTFGRNTSRFAKPRDIQGILSRVQPSVVAISTRGFQQDEFFNVVPSEGAGTGMIPCCERTKPLPAGSGETIISLSSSRSKPQAAVTMSIIESTAPTS